MLTYWEILTAIQSDIPIYDSYAKLWGEKLSNAYTTTTYTGTLPATLTGTKAGYLHGYKIYGNLTQNGTPTPENPIYPSECGELETTGVHAGQYKLPLTSAGQSVDIYLGESQTTRRIKKLVLTGEETFTLLEEGLYRVTVNGYLRELGLQIGICTHFGGGMTVNAAPRSKLNAVSFLVSSSGNNYIYFSPSQYLTVNDFKTYLAQQYASGTPVTVWYVLENPETGTLNEPLRKIGNYADTIDSTQTSAQMPTSANSTTISWAGEGIAPSKVELEYEKRR